MATSEELEEKRRRLAALKLNRSKANCSDKYSSAADMRRALEIEGLEDEIRALEKQLSS